MALPCARQRLTAGTRRIQRLCSVGVPYRDGAKWDPHATRRIGQEQDQLRIGQESMAENRAAKVEPKKPVVKKKDRAAEIANTFEWLITAFILAFVFRAFVMEAFRIPDRQHGRHAQRSAFPAPLPAVRVRLRSWIRAAKLRHARGHRAARGRCRSASRRGAPVAVSTRPPERRCRWPTATGSSCSSASISSRSPNAGTSSSSRTRSIRRRTTSSGSSDCRARRSRSLTAISTSTDSIARKPPQVQKELWMPVYDHDFQPVNPNERPGFNGHRWQPPFNLEGSAWKVSDENPDTTGAGLSRGPDRACSPTARPRRTVSRPPMPTTKCTCYGRMPSAAI